MAKLNIYRGLPASGKTTSAREEVKWELQALDGGIHCDDPLAHKVLRVNRDEIRNMLHNGKYIHGITEEAVIAVRDGAIRAALRKGWDVISDDTNLKSRNVRELMKIARNVGAEVEFVDFTDIDAEECIHRDAQRGVDCVGPEVIRDQYNRFLKGKSLPLPIPELEDTPKFEPLPFGTVPAIIVDLDGTTAINDGHRGFFDYDRVRFDEPNESVVELVQSEIRAGKVALFLSGRQDVCREDTADWITRFILRPVALCTNSDAYPNRYPNLLRFPNHNQVSRHKLFMRREGDMRDDALIKYEIYRDYIAQHFNVYRAYDDRDRVVSMWRQIGITCLQVDYGDF